MIWAIKDDLRIQAVPKIKDATCPICSKLVIPKCGTLKAPHWAHKSNKDCDNWAEHETIWHLNWKNEFPKECQEVTIGKHRADIKTASKIIELQNSSISPEEIVERENFYNQMIWLINGEKFAKGLILRNKDNIFTFRWKNPPKSWWMASCPIYIDLSYQVAIFDKMINEASGNRYEDKRFILAYKKLKKQFEDKPIFLIKKVYCNIPCGGWGILLSKKDFLNQQGVSK